jgi:hypothetical protein
MVQKDVHSVKDIQNALLFRATFFQQSAPGHSAMSKSKDRLRPWIESLSSPWHGACGKIIKTTQILFVGKAPGKPGKFEDRTIEEMEAEEKQ